MVLRWAFRRRRRGEGAGGVGGWGGAVGRLLLGGGGGVGLLAGLGAAQVVVHGEGDELGRPLAQVHKLHKRLVHLRRAPHIYFVNF